MKRYSQIVTDDCTIKYGPYNRVSIDKLAVYPCQKEFYVIGQSQVQSFDLSFETVIEQLLALFI